MCFFLIPIKINIQPLINSCYFCLLGAQNCFQHLALAEWLAFRNNLPTVAHTRKQKTGFLRPGPQNYRITGRNSDGGNLAPEPELSDTLTLLGFLSLGKSSTCSLGGGPHSAPLPTH